MNHKNILITGAAGFIGTNLTLRLAQDQDNRLTVTDESDAYFATMKSLQLPAVTIRPLPFDATTDFAALLQGQEIVYHLASSTNPSTSNRDIAGELTKDVVTSARFLDACVACGVRRVVFVSSGGTVYGADGTCPHREEDATNPISSYGLQKLTIEKLLHIYHHMHGLDYRVVRFSNLYGPYQRPNGVLGAVTTFIDHALKEEEITIYGDGSVVRDYLYIDDAVDALLRIAKDESERRIYNVGSGEGISINQLLETIRDTLGTELRVRYSPARSVDVPVNYLDTTRYEETFGKTQQVALPEGIRKTADFIRGMKT